MSKRNARLDRANQALRRFALGFPEAHEDFPWGERVIKVRKKVFVFMGHEGEGLGVSVKLPESQTMALMLPFTEPTGYGLGRSGWITASFSSSDDPPTELLEDWIEESYRAVAPKTLIRTLDDGASSTRHK